MSNHQDLTGRGAVHPFAFVASVDPTGDATNEVGPYKAWIDTSNTPPQLKIRNDNNTAWITVLGTAGGGGAIIAFAHLTGRIHLIAPHILPIESIPETFHKVDYL